MKLCPGTTVTSCNVKNVSLPTLNMKDPENIYQWSILYRLIYSNDKLQTLEQYSNLRLNISIDLVYKLQTLEQYSNLRLNISIDLVVIV